MQKNDCFNNNNNNNSNNNYYKYPDKFVQFKGK